MKKQKALPANSGITLVVTFFIFCAINAIVFLLGNSLFPNQIVLGTLHISRAWAIIHPVSTLALIQAFLLPFIHHYKIKKNEMPAVKKWSGIYLVINMISLWIIGRLADQLGLGLASWRAVLALAVIISLIQNQIMVQLKKCHLNQK